MNDAGFLNPFKLIYQLSNFRHSVAEFLRLWRRDVKTLFAFSFRTFGEETVEVQLRMDDYA